MKFTDDTYVDRREECMRWKAHFGDIHVNAGKLSTLRETEIDVRSEN